VTSAEGSGEAVDLACSLGAGSLEERVGEWRALVSSSVVAVEAEATSVRLVLDESPEALAAAASLAQREKQCCPFFDVAILIGPVQRTLRLTVPAGAEEAMAAFVEMLRR
jgi:hypothetical protein